jgi:hypothetical protein
MFKKTIFFRRIISYLICRLLPGKTLVKKTGIGWLKSKFFIYRLVTYFSFLLIPVWIQKSLSINPGIQTLIMIFYSLFMVGQWYLLGKEIDHRLKIYFKVSSSIDRILYRILTGKIFLIFIFDLFALLPQGVINHFFWGLWVVLGLYYSWPTRGKIIRESVTTQFGEIIFLDSFEKTLFGLILVFFVISIPEIPALTQLESLKLYLDPYEKLSPPIVEFYVHHLFPVSKIPGSFQTILVYPLLCHWTGDLSIGLLCFPTFFLFQEDFLYLVYLR